MTQGNIRQHWLDYRDLDNVDRVASKSSQLVVLDLIRLYRTLTPEQRKEIDQLLAEELNSDDPSARFDSMAVIQEFKITSAVASLIQLTDRLRGMEGPQAQNELVKAQSLVDELS
jgi:hypothetical protein